MTDFFTECGYFIYNNFYYFLGYYIIMSFYGYHIMREYIKECHHNNVIPFNNSILKMTVASLICGFFTTLVIIVGIVMSIVDFFSKKY